MVEVDEADVTRLGVRLQQFAVLVGVRSHLCLVLEKSVRLVTVEETKLVSFLVACDVVAVVTACVDRLAEEFLGLVLDLRQVKAYAVLEVAYVVVPIDAQLPSAGTDTTDVLPHLRVPVPITEDKKVVRIHKHVVRLLLEVVGRNLQAAVEKGHVDTYVPILHRLPLKGCVAEGAKHGTCYTVGVGAEHVIGCAYGADVSRVVDVLVTYLTPACADFQVVKEFLVLHERLGRYTPCA